MATERHGDRDGGGEVRAVKDVPDHFVRPARATTIPQTAIFVDCESTAEPSPDGIGDVQSFRLGHAICVRRMHGEWVRRDELTFTDTFDFWEFVVSKTTPKRPVWIFAHNLNCDATWLGTWERLDDESLRLNVPCPACGGFFKDQCKTHTPFRGAAVVSDPPVILCFRCATGVVRMVDTMNYWKTSVFKLGKGIGYPKIMILGPSPDDDVLEQYCRVDTEIIEKSVCGFLDEWEKNQCGHFAATAAGLAWNSFRRTVEPKTILIDHGEPHTPMERSAYYGGQAEAFYVGRVREPVWLLDVRSLYPSVMAASYFPVKFIRMGTELDIRKVQARLLFDAAVARVVVKTERAGYPYRIKGGIRKEGIIPSDDIVKGLRLDPDRLGFPVGRYATSLAGPELLRGIERGEVEEILSIAWYRTAKIFGPFVAEWFERRPDELTPETFARDLLCKTVLNSMSGYFSKHKMRWKDRPGIRPLYRWGEWSSIHAQTGKITRWRGVGGECQELEESGESRDSFPAISAYITAFGREQMLWLREQCPDRSIYYQDTDSLIANREAVGRLNALGLIGAGELGKLRLLGELTGLTIHAVKDYEHAHGRCAAGVKITATREGPGLFRQEVWESIADQWSRTPDGTVRVHQGLIHLSRTRMARQVQRDGWTLPPRVDTKTEVPF